MYSVMDCVKYTLNYIKKAHKLSIDKQQRNTGYLAMAPSDMTSL